MTPEDFNRQTAHTLVSLANDLLEGKYQASQWEMSEEPGEFYVQFYRRNPCKFQIDLS